MPGEILRVDTDYLSGAVFAPFMEFMDKVVERTDADMHATAPLVPRRAAEIDDYVIKLEKQLVPLVQELLTSVQNLPRGDAESVDALAALLESVEETNVKEATPGVHDPGNHV
ncbi:MAG TPA: hypothetical protein VFA49_06420 [Chloroflexota bacterium]|jgi:hypothetical protein|nr:hypothetical protein [Chloroflexota bacterium]